MCELGSKKKTGKMLCYLAFIGVESCRWERIKTEVLMMASGQSEFTVQSWAEK